MKVIVTLHSPAIQVGELAPSTITHKGKALDINQLDNGGYVVTDDGAPIAVYPSGSVHHITLKGKKPEPQNGYATPSLADQIADALRRNFSYDGFANVIADGIAKAERLADEKSQARWAVESNPVATEHPDFEAFINSKMTSEDCAQFGVGVARAERDQYKAQIDRLEGTLAGLAADIERDDLPQAMQDREMLYGRITKLQECLEAQLQSTASSDSYMRGMYNGLILAEATMLDQEPCYMDPPAVRSEAIVDPKAFDASPALGAGVPEVEFTDLDDNTPTVDKGGLKKK